MCRRECIFIFALLLFAVAARTVAAQEIRSAPGNFDYYLLNMSWSPAFCDNMKTLSPSEQADAGEDMRCSAPHAFVMHGLWPQNNNGTYPANCSTVPGPRSPQRYVSLIPNVALVRHEWAKHGTCTTLSPDAYFSTAQQAFSSVTIPDLFKQLDKETEMAPEAILGMFYKSNPTFPQGSFALACANNQLTAVEACMDKDVKPIACVNLKSCNANAVKIAPENSGVVVQ